MKYYSEQLSKFYDTAEACEAAEAEAKSAQEAKKAAEDDAKAQLQIQQDTVNAIREQYNALGKHYNEEYTKLSKMLSAYSRKYGYVPKGFSTLDILFDLL